MLAMFFNKILGFTAEKVRIHGSQHYVFIVFALLNYFAPMFITKITEKFTYELIALRSIAILLCAILVLTDIWPRKWRSRYFPLCWYITLWFCLPFVATYTVLLAKGEEMWFFNMTLSMLLLMMLVDWISFIVLAGLGVTLSYITYLILDHTHKYIPADDIYLFAYLCAFVLLMGVSVLRQKENSQSDKVKAMQLFGGAIAHEINSPLAAIQMLAITLSDLTKNLSEKAEKKISDGGEESYRIELESIDYQMLFDFIPNGFLNISREASKVVQVLLMALKGSIVDKDREHSVAEVIQEALSSYTFSNDQRRRISCDFKNDFTFVGSKEMFRHVIYNLIRNAFKHGGEQVNINIWLYQNKLHFKDNGAGISEKEIKNIFKSFYTTSETGTGIGLAFCSIVMKGIGGRIECNSVLGKYAEFILTFPPN
ncbi:membrane hypothetical protein [Alphaproteobacteria bacterium]